MKNNLSKLAILLTVGVAISGCAAAQQSSTPSAAENKTESKSDAALNTPKAKSSYAIGMNIAKSLQHDEIDVDPAMLMRGLTDALNNQKPLLSEEDAKAAITTLQQETRARREAQQKALADSNAKEGAAFLAENKSKADVKTLPSGLQYKVLKQGDGSKPTSSDSVECNYRGTLINGKEFDSSYKRGKPASFPVTGVIKGWTEILQLMPVGSKYQVYIPSELAYGQRAPGEIGPNATLIFEIELLSIKEKPKAASAPAPAPAADAKPAPVTK
jgi:FKBP-type peptidyl-prolyl cis-trans isomerase